MKVARVSLCPVTPSILNGKPTASSAGRRDADLLTQPPANRRFWGLAVSDTTGQVPPDVIGEAHQQECRTAW